MEELVIWLLKHDEFKRLKMEHNNNMVPGILVRMNRIVNGKINKYVNQYGK